MYTAKVSICSTVPVPLLWRVRAAWAQVTAWRAGRVPVVVALATFLLLVLPACGAGSAEAPEVQSAADCAAQGTVDAAGNLIVTCGSSVRVIPAVQWLAPALRQAVGGQR